MALVMKYKKELAIAFSMFFCAMIFVFSLLIIGAWEEAVGNCSERSLKCMSPLEFAALQFMGVPGAILSIGIVGITSWAVFIFDGKSRDKDSGAIPSNASSHKALKTK